MIAGARENAYQALADRIGVALSSVDLDSVSMAGWTVTRVYRNFDDLDLPQPACVVVATMQEPVGTGPGNVHLWRLDAHAIVQFRDVASDSVSDSHVNQIIDAIDDCLNAQPNEPDSDGGVHTTLGGAVIRASIEGKIIIDQGVPGTLETQTFVVIPITMLVSG